MEVGAVSSDPASNKTGLMTESRQVCRLAAYGHIKQTCICSYVSEVLYFWLDN